MLYPMIFQPIFKERVWGGRRLETTYHKALPPSVPIGESWEITDRPEASSVILNGPLAGKDLHWVMENHRRELLGQGRDVARFPLLIKILDAQQVLSVQVHPPAAVASQLGGEPKTEMWYITESAPGSEVYIGLKKGVGREEFAQKMAQGTVADCIHRQPVELDDSIFLPSGRIHALGAGLVLFEIQQNSDTTYRVFDWNRTGLDGKPRELHIEQAMASIDFNDFEPEIQKGRHGGSLPMESRSLVKDPLFSVDAWRARAGESYRFACQQPLIVGVSSGYLRVHGGEESVRLTPGGFCLVPAVVGRVTLAMESDANFLTVQPC
jgi:mannose-6-phosphate isomerase